MQEVSSKFKLDFSGYEINNILSQARNSEARMSEIEKQLSDALYKEISIVSFTAQDAVTGKSTLEIGTKVKDVTFTWSFNKTPETLTLDGDAMDEESTGITLPVNITGTSNKSWTLRATDERNVSVPKTAGLSFLNGVYYGVLPTVGTITSESIRGMEKSLQSVRTMNFTVTPSSGMRPAYALPSSSSYGTPIFKIGGLEYEWTRVRTNFEFTNASGYKEKYDVWMHNKDVSGSITINVS